MIETKDFVKIRSNGEHLIIISDHESLENIRADFCFYVPNAHFTPAFKAKRWDGKKHFITGGMNVGHAPVGLLYDIVRWFKRKLYTVEWEDYRTPIPFKMINPTMGDIVLRQYQLEAASACLQCGGGIIKLPTGSGKSAVITAVIRQNMAVNPDVLSVIVVPRSSLVLQFYDEMVNEYGINKKYVGMWGGGKKTWKGQPVLITTMQSICKQTKKQGRSKIEIVREITQKVMEYNVMMFIDECHQAACKSLTDIVDMVKPQWLFGFTGSLPEEDVPLMEIKGIMGNILYSKKTKELMDLGFLPPMKLMVLKLKHDKKKFKKFMADLEAAKIKERIQARIDAGITEEADGEEEEEQKNEKYLAEIDYMSKDLFRNNVIRKIAETHTRKGENVLILVERISHGDNISAFMNGNIFLHGKDKPAIRYEIQKQCESSKGMVIIATSGIFAMGVSIKRLHGIILAGISSAKIGLVQAIGRGLREHESKEMLNVYDIADTSEYSNRHLRKRLKVFDNEDFAYKVMEV